MLAQKGGVDPRWGQERHPRIAEFPLDSAHKFMATFHPMNDRVAMLVQGAPDVLLARSTRWLGAGGQDQPLDESVRRSVTEAHQAFADQALRVLALARRSIPAAPSQGRRRHGGQCTRACRPDGRIQHPSTNAHSPRSESPVLRRRADDDKVPDGRSAGPRRPGSPRSQVSLGQGPRGRVNAGPYRQGQPRPTAHPRTGCCQSPFPRRAGDCLAVWSRPHPTSPGPAWGSRRLYVRPGR